jgi:membrane fusion protein, multidrug efflux system
VPRVTVDDAITKGPERDPAPARNHLMRSTVAPPHRPARTRASGPLGLAFTVAVALALAVAGCTNERAESKAEKTPSAQAQRRLPVPVAIAQVERRAVPLQIEAIGTVEAYAVVSVKAQVGGELLRIHFKEGQDVRKGDLLFSIDPRPFEAALAQAQANLAKDQVQIQQARAALARDQARVHQTRAAVARDLAQAKNADVQARRYAALLKSELIPQEQYDQIRTTADSMAETVKADQADVQSAEQTLEVDEAAIRSAEQLVHADEAAVDNAKIQLGYTVIRSPINGRTGSLGLNQGNLVRASGTNDSTLITINQLQPIFVSFTVPQQQLPAIKQYMADGTLDVRALPAGDPRPARGAVTFVDNTVDQTTGTIRLKATFTNDDRRLWPGQFVNVTLTLTTQTDAIVVPSQAVQTGQQGAYVFVVKADSTVDTRPVTLARTQGNEAIVAKGLEAGERVVTDGQPRLVQGAAVEIRTGGRPGGNDGDAPSRGRGAPAPARTGK